MLQTPRHQRLIFGTITDVAFEGDEERATARITLTDEGLTQTAVTDDAEIMGRIGQIMTRKRETGDEPFLSLRVSSVPDTELGKPRIISLNNAVKSDHILQMSQVREGFGPGFDWRASPIPKLSRKTRLH